MLIKQVVVEAREGSIVAKGVPQRRVGTAPLVNPLQRLIAGEGDQARFSRTKSIEIRRARQLCHADSETLSKHHKLFYITAAAKPRQWAHGRVDVVSGE